jgi:hypothetical protein
MFNFALLLDPATPEPKLGLKAAAFNYYPTEKWQIRYYFV